MKYRIYHRFIISCFWAIICSAVLAVTAAAQTTVFITSHADPETKDDNSPLSIKGQCRANGLSLLLSDAKIRHIFISEYPFSQQTAAPVSLLCGVKPEVVPLKDFVALIAKTRKAAQPGESILIVTHRETVAKIVKTLGNVEIEGLGIGEYTRLVAVTIFPDGRASVVTMRHGVECDTTHDHAGPMIKK